MSLEINTPQIPTNDGTYSITTASGDCATVTKNGDKFIISNTGITEIVEIDVDEFLQMVLRDAITDISVPKSVLVCANTLITSNAISDLMKMLLITLMLITNAHRENSLNARNGTMNALESKLSSMEEAAAKEYASAQKSAWMNIVSGCISMTTGVAMATLSITGATGHSVFKVKGTMTDVEKQVTGMANQSLVQAVGQMGNAASSLTQGIYGFQIADLNREAQTERKEVELANAIMEFFRQALTATDQSMESLMNQLRTIVQLLADIQQNIKATEQLIAQSMR